MGRNSVLALAADLDQLRRIVANLERAGAGVDAVRSAEHVPGRIELGVIPHRYVFFAVDGPNAPELLNTLPSLRNHCHVTVIAAKADLACVVSWMEDPRINHVIVGKEGLDEAIFVTAQKLITGDIFGIEKYLPEGTPVQYLRFHDPAGRAKALDTVVEFADHARLRKQVRSAIVSVTDELVMNALYDAPVDDHGHQIFAHIPAADRALMPSPKPVSLRYAATESQFAIAVRDRFGRLAKNTLVSYLRKCLHEDDPIDRKQMGAGLGLYLIANAAASFVVNVAYGVATEIVCTFDRGAKAPLRLSSMFVHPGDEDMMQRGPTPETRDG